MLIALPMMAAACGEGIPIVVSLELPADHDPFQGVAMVRLQVSGPAMAPVQAEASRDADEVNLPPISFGPGRRILVEGLDSQRFVISRGESAPFEVTANGPERVTVPFAACRVDLSVDLDADGHGSGGSQRQGCSQPGWATSDNDCDDGDPQAYPGQNQFFSVPRLSGGFDFNCDGNEEPQSTAVLDSCPPACKGEGWNSAAPSCGAPGNFLTCQKTGPDCVGDVQQRTQACR